MSSRTDVIWTYYRLIDGPDPLSIIDLYADHVVYERGTYPIMKGRLAVERFYREQRPIQSGVHRIVILEERGGSVFVQGEFEGDLKDGRHVIAEFSDEFRFEDGRISWRRTTFPGVEI